MKEIAVFNFENKKAKQETIGSVFKKILNTYHKLPKHEQDDLVKQIMISGDRKLCEKLFNHNFKFVLAVCKAMNIHEDTASFADLLAGGAHGLWAAVEKVKKGFYNPTRSNFLSFASYYIQGYALTETVQHNRFVKLSSLVYYSMLLLAKKEDKYFGATGEELPLEDQYNFLRERFSANRVKALLHLKSTSFVYGSSKFKKEMDSDTLHISEVDAMDTVSVSNDFLRSFIKDDFYSALKEVYGKKESKAAKQQFDVIVLYYGLQMDKPLNLDQVGK